MKPGNLSIFREGANSSISLQEMRDERNDNPLFEDFFIFCS